MSAKNTKNMNQGKASDDWIWVYPSLASASETGINASNNITIRFLILCWLNYLLLPTVCQFLLPSRQHPWAPEKPDVPCLHHQQKMSMAHL